VQVPERSDHIPILAFNPASKGAGIREPQQRNAPIRQAGLHFLKKMDRRVHVLQHVDSGNPIELISEVAFFKNVPVDFRLYVIADMLHVGARFHRGQPPAEPNDPLKQFQVRGSDVQEVSLKR
jgi:hypothetical protein